MAENYLYHHGILGMKWGIRRYQNADGSLTEAGRKRYVKSDGSVNAKKYTRDLKRFEKQDEFWARRKERSITNKTYKSIKKELTAYEKNELRKSGLKGQYYINHYNQKMAALMNEKVSNIESPSGKVVRFVAKRGNHEVGVYMALATPDYNMSNVKNGVYGSGKIGYKNDYVDKG